MSSVSILPYNPFSKTPLSNNEWVYYNYTQQSSYTLDLTFAKPTTIYLFLVSSGNNGKPGNPFNISSMLSKGGIGGKGGSYYNTEITNVSGEVSFKIQLGITPYTNTCVDIKLPGKDSYPITVYNGTNTKLNKLTSVTFLGDNNTNSLIKISGNGGNGGDGNVLYGIEPTNGLPGGGGGGGGGGGSGYDSGLMYHTTTGGSGINGNKGNNGNTTDNNNGGGNGGNAFNFVNGGIGGGGGGGGGGAISNYLQWYAGNLGIGGIGGCGAVMIYYKK